MHKIFRVALSFLLAIAVAYPLLFWGTATLSDNKSINVDKEIPCTAIGPRESVNCFFGSETAFKAFAHPSGDHHWITSRS